MPTPCLDPTSDLDQWVNEFERAWQEAGDAAMAAFLPPREHPQFDRILCELVCVDLEMRWSRGKPKNLVEYRREHPELFQSPSVLQEVAYEEYRQRIQAGDPVDPQEYRARLGIDVSGWPPTPGPVAGPNGERTHVIATGVIAEGLPRTTVARVGIVKALRNSAPRTAERLENAEERMPRPGDRVFGFELVEALGEGAFATVFRARQAELADRSVALKIAPTLLDEPRKLARLQHTNIVPIYSVHRSDVLEAVCMPYLGTMTLEHLLRSMSDKPGSFPRSGQELLSTLFDRKSVIGETQAEGDTLKSVPDRNGDSAVATPILDMMARFSHIEAVLWIGARLADGLAHAHERGILHLDLKPANVLLTDDGQPMLLDFNLSLDLHNPVSVQKAHFGGTLPYMSPEQLSSFQKGTRDVDARSDLFSLGVLLFQMLTGTSPFPKRLGEVRFVIDRMIADRQTRPPSLRQHNAAIPRAVEAIVQKLLEPSVARRYQSAAHLREDFERQLAHQPLRHAPDRSIPERCRKWRYRHPRFAIAGVVALVAGIFFLLPATVLAVRQSQIAERQMQVETAEAKQQWQESGREARTVQMLLATRLGNRAQIDQGIKRGTRILEKHGVGSDPEWMSQPLFTRLTSDEQNEVRLELGEMLLFMARGEQLRAGDSTDPMAQQRAFQTALAWNTLAAKCYPPGQLPRLLVRQGEELVKVLPREADQFRLPTPGSSAEHDPYHEGVAHAMADRYREALLLLRPFSENHPRHFQSWFVRGICHQAIGENAEAAACWTGCVALEPDVPWTYFNRGIVRLQESDYPRASRDFTRALEIQPGWIDARLNRAIARKGMKDYAGAIQDLDEVITKADASVRACILRAEIKELANKPDEAKLDRAEAMKQPPRDELDWSTRGYARMTSEPARALEDFNEAIALNPRSREALINKSIVLSELLDRARDSIAVFDRFLDYYPDHVGMRLGRGVVLARLGECNKARRDAEECLKLDRSPFFLFQAAGLYAQLARHERGGDARQEALRLLGSALRKGFTDLELLRSDHDLDPIREEAEFKRLLTVAAGLEK